MCSNKQQSSSQESLSKAINAQTSLHEQKKALRSEYKKRRDELLRCRPKRHKAASLEACKTLSELFDKILTKNLDELGFFSSVNAYQEDLEAQMPARQPLSGQLPSRQALARELPTGQPLSGKLPSKQAPAGQLPHLSIFWSFGSEIQLQALFDWAYRIEERYHFCPLSLPVVCAKKTEAHNMLFLRCSAHRLQDELPDYLKYPAKVYTLKPQDSKHIASPQSQKLILIPGLAFDNTGGRLGYGGGYYDRYLDEHKDSLRDCLLLAPCFKEQLCSAVPRDTHDKKVDKLLVV